MHTSQGVAVIVELIHETNVENDQFVCTTAKTRAGMKTIIKPIKWLTCVTVDDVWKT